MNESWFQMSDQIGSVDSISHGDVAQYYDVCGYNSLIGAFTLCPKCKAAGRDGCGRYFVVGKIRGVGDG